MDYFLVQLIVSEMNTNLAFKQSEDYWLSDRAMDEDNKHLKSLFLS